MKAIPTTLRLAQLAVVVLVFHIAHSLLQEEVFHLPGFHHALLLSFLQATCISLFAAIDFVRQNGWNAFTASERKTPLQYYVALAVMAVVTSFATNEASIRLNYPTQVIFKSSKLLAVMALRSIMMQHKGKLSGLDIASACAVVIGLCAFTFATHSTKSHHHHHHGTTASAISSSAASSASSSLATKVGSHHHHHHHDDERDGGLLEVTTNIALETVKNASKSFLSSSSSSSTASSLAASYNFILGLVFVLIAVATDALLYLVEEKYCFHTFGSSSGEILVFLNGFAAVNAGGAMILSGNVPSAFEYVSETSVIIPIVLVFSLCNFIGSTAVLSIVSEFGSPSAIIVTNTRKVCTILGSFLVYPKPFTFLHGLGLLLVSGGIYAHEIARKKKAAVRPDDEEQEGEPAATPL